MLYYSYYYYLYYILYYTIILLYLIHILLYIILYYTLPSLLFFSSFPLPSVLFSSISLLSFPPLHSRLKESILHHSSSNHLIQSIRVGIWISLFIFNHSNPLIQSSFPSPSSPSHPNIHSIRVGPYIYLLIFNHTFLPSFLSFLVFSSFPIYLSFPSSHSFYTCQYLDPLTYIPDNLTPHVLSEWMVEVCRFY